MSRNSRIIAVLTGALTVAALGTLPGAGTAAAEPVFVPKAGDVVGVGSDTTQFALNYLADGHDGVAGYNTAGTSGRLVTFDALGEGLPAQITLREGTAPITRPNGSGAGKALLYGAGNNVAVDYARSSSALSQAEVSANLQQLPFAVDGLRLAVRAAGSNAPATITPAQLVDIFDGTVTNWNQIGGAAGAIVPLVPQSGSGTRSFFLSQLKAANGGVDVTLAPSVVETQEHSDADVKGNLNAIAPFSTGRAKTAPTVKLLGGADKGGFEANRALYNVVRQGDLASSWARAIFGPAGFVCSEEARPLIEAAGFGQLATPANGGVCGEATQAATTNFTTTQTDTSETRTRLGSQVKVQKVTLTATVAAVSGSSAPEGTVRFTERGTLKKTVGVSGGKAIATLARVSAGKHAYVATFVPTDENLFLGSRSASQPVSVKQPSRTAASMDKRFPAGERVKATIRVVATGGAKGAVVIKDGTRRIATATLRASKATVTLPRLKPGRHSLSFRYLGSAATAASQSKVRVTVTR